MARRGPRAGRLIRSTGRAETDEVETYHDRVREAVVSRLEPGRLWLCIIISARCRAGGPRARPIPRCWDCTPGVAGLPERGGRVLCRSRR